ncbi:hypothetical protein [Enterococcus viikkiensis]|uniref:hypothetical protein n=1 Tax=Enterococcus viikkiensis TaxID=930854 RepID=UPI0010F67B5E|nr:hypothetical protein [Enterococcus viikkiensis]
MMNMEDIAIPAVPTITAEHKELVEAARATLLDKGKATPFALLGTEEVVGTNYWILCRIEVPETKGDEMLTVYKIYQSPEGEVSLVEASAFEFETAYSESFRFSA